MLLPDLVSDVLLRLPVKSLLRFRCLYKSICAEIDSAEFVNNHLKRSTKTKTHQKLIIKKIYVFYAADFDDSLREITPLPLCCPLKYPQSGTVVCGGVLNGLILLGTIVKLEFLTIRLILWNPFTRRYKNIPTYECTSFNDHLNGCGLGYDSAVDDYKTVMILSHFNSNGLLSKVLVFSLKSNSWTRIEDVPPLVMTNWPTSTTGSALYWTCYNNDLDELKILGFDVANEALFCFPLPGSGLRVVLDGNIYASQLHNGFKTQEFYLRMSDKDEEEAGGIWRKAFVVDEGGLNEFGYDFSRPLTYSKEGDNILLCNGNKLSWYDPEKKTRQRININISWSYNYAYNVCSESLVSLGSDTAFDGEAEEVPADV